MTVKIVVPAAGSLERMSRRAGASIEARRMSGRGAARWCILAICRRRHASVRLRWYAACMIGGMNPTKPDSKPFTLELVEIDTPADDPSRGVGAVTQTKSLGITNADMFLEAAAREYQSGKVDKALWARTQGVAGDDESIAIAAYLRGRAAVLRDEQRNARAAKASDAGTAAPRTRTDGPPTASRGMQGPPTATRGGAAARPRAA